MTKSIEQEKPKEYDCTCFKCLKKFMSTNEDDTFDSKCADCIKSTAEIAKDVDAKMAVRGRMPRIQTSFAPTARNGQSGFMGIRESIPRY